MTSQTDCVFCAIVAGDAPASVVDGDEELLAFMDARPVNAGHLLVIPRAHASGLRDLPAATGGRMFEMAQRLAAALYDCEAITCEGVNLFLADGAAAFQEVFHVHVHVVPRFSGDGFRLDASWRTAERDELDAVAAELRTTLTHL